MKKYFSSIINICIHSKAKHGKKINKLKILKSREGSGSVVAFLRVNFWVQEVANPSFKLTPFPGSLKQTSPHEKKHWLFKPICQSGKSIYLHHHMMQAGPERLFSFFSMRPHCEKSDCKRMDSISTSQTLTDSDVRVVLRCAVWTHFLNNPGWCQEDKTAPCSAQNPSGLPPPSLFPL